MLTCCNNAGPNNGVCETCINFNLFEITLPDGGTIGEFRCTASHCDNGSKFKLRAPETESEVRKSLEQWG